MVSALRTQYPSARTSMLVRSYTKELAEGYRGIENILLYDQSGERKPFFTMLEELRAGRFDLVVVSYPTLRLALLMFLAGIPTRVGTGYRWYSFFFNKRVFEHRKTAERHEVEYNLSLLKAIGCAVEGVPRISLAISEKEEKTAKDVARSIGISNSDAVVVLHPGSGGSARDWSVENFAALARQLHSAGYKVVVTGGGGEESLVQRVVEAAQGAAVPLVGRLSLKELAAFLRSVKLFVSNSTGPLHIAAVVGTPVIAFYPPIRECSARRWGPLTEKKVIFTADNKICARCQGKECLGDDCMDQIKVEQVFSAARSLIAAAKETNEPIRNVRPTV